MKNKQYFNQKYFEIREAILKNYGEESQQDAVVKILEEIVRPLEKPDNMLGIDFAVGRGDMKRECLEKLKTAWVNTNGKYDINKAVAVIKAIKI